MHHKARQIGLWGVVLILGAGLVWLGRVASPTPLADIPPAPRPGAPAPDFELMTLGGEPVSLAELRGQAVVINLWATWCPPCRAEMPAMQRVYEDYRDEGLVILAINQREDPADVRAFVDEFGLTFPILLDTDGAVGAAYELRAYPSTYFIDRAGVVRAYAFGGPLDESYFESQVLQIME